MVSPKKCSEKTFIEIQNLFLAATTKREKGEGREDKTKERKKREGRRKKEKEERKKRKKEREEKKKGKMAFAEGDWG